MRVLILEDDPWIADLLKQIVLSLRPGARVDCQVRVADAISAWQREPAQLVIADWNLPDGSGTLLLQAVRSQDPEVALVMITEGAEGARAFRAAGARQRPAMRVSVVDTVGAGDTFNAGFLAGLAKLGALSRAGLAGLEDAQIDACLDLGIRASAVTVSRAGANPPWAHELKEQPV